MFSNFADFVKKWWIVVLVGILFIVSGCIALANKLLAFEALAILLVVMIIAAGIAEIIYVLKNTKNIPAWGWNLLGAVIVLLMGIALAGKPLAANLLVIYFFGLGFIFAGINGIANSLKLKDFGADGWGWVLAFGIINIIVGIVALFNIQGSALAISIILGIGLIAFGINLIVSGIVMSKANSVIKDAEKTAEEIAEEAQKYVEGLAENRAAKAGKK